MYEKLFCATALTVILVGCTKTEEAILVNFPVVQEIPDSGLRAVFKNIAGDRVFFAFDRFDLSRDSIAELNKQIEWLSSYPGVKFTIEGHADERGTSQYNLELGKKRAASVRNYFLSKGIPEKRMRTISFGKECPEDARHNPEAWAKNRRAVTVIN